MLNDGTCARMRRVLDGRLDQVAAARRLASLADAAGHPNPFHVASLFKVRWKMSRHIEMVRRRSHENGGRW
jgi:hypothetical protein